MLITPEYRALNAKLHENPSYGTSGHKWAPMVRRIIKERAFFSILDYGCGKRTLEEALGQRIQNYDPCIPGLEAKHPAELVVCTDVLEHIEPDLIENVLDDLRAMTLEMAFLVVATRPAVKVLPDGRNAHILLREYSWWLPKFWQRWNLIAFENFGGEFFVILDNRS